MTLERRAAMLLLNVLKPECEKRGLPVNTMEPERLAMLAIGVQYGLIDHHNARQKIRDYLDLA